MSILLCRYVASVNQALINKDTVLLFVSFQLVFVYLFTYLLIYLFIFLFIYLFILLIY